jgi:oligopeptidase B
MDIPLVAPRDEMNTPPLAARIESVRRLHGDADADDYAWMRDHSAPEFGAYLAAERAYYDAHAARLAGLASRLSAESAARIGDRADESVAWPRAGYLYRTRTPAGSENAQFLRSPVLARGADPPEPPAGPARPAGVEGEQLLLDENVIGAGTGYVDVAVREPSPDGTLLAWSADTSGAEIYRLRIRDLRTGADLPDEIERSYPGAVWSADSRYLFYLVPDEVNRPFQVRRHLVGTSAADDVLVYAESDARFEITLHATRSGQFAVITSQARDTTEVRLIPLGDPLADPVLIEPRHRRLEYRIDHAKPVENEGLGWLYIATDADEPEFGLVRAPAGAPGRANWAAVECAAIAPARPGTRLHAVDVLAGHLLLTLRREGESLLAITDHDGGNVREVRAGVACGSIRVAHAEDYHAGSVIIAEESLVEPPAWYRLDLGTGERILLKRQEVAGYSPDRYLTERVRAPAADGTAIPVTLAYARGTRLDGTAPCLLYGYGAYESCADPEFSVGLPSLLDRGVVYAIAHVRGGGECGRSWWQQGRLRAKPTTFSDFIDVADWLAGGGAGLVDGRRIVCRGLSAGGLLQGAVYSMRPDRWRAVVAEVPFVDVVTTMLDPTIPLTANEWDEWGDPRDPQDYACMRSYSPYDNPPSGVRPPLLVTGAVADPRVGVHEPAKWVARLRATATTAQAAESVLLRVELGVGAHTGPSGRFAQVGYEAEVHAFVLDAMGISQ